MIEVIILLEYAELCGHPMWRDGDKLMVKHGSDIPWNLKEQIIAHKQDILTLLDYKETA